ncbi:hypothetical protein ANN_22844 [Periplaneta americana]|uniref:Uncharacterized protein n=1 Tax=Periplaneta americana TaxID=6978 RepID=A0ABQ8SJK8_PERAM|nr:hypothetical protein ANN_22844 [Periplaneta americana]
MAGLCEGGNEPPGSLKASNRSPSETRYIFLLVPRWMNLLQRGRARQRLTVDTQEAMGRDFHTNNRLHVGGGRSSDITQW